MMVVDCYLEDNIVVNLQREKMFKNFKNFLLVERYDNPYLIFNIKYLLLV